MNARAGACQCGSSCFSGSFDRRRCSPQFGHTAPHSQRGECHGSFSTAPGEDPESNERKGREELSFFPAARFAVRLVDQIRQRTMQLTPVVCDAAMVACESSGELDHLWLLLVSSEPRPMPKA